MSYLYGFLLKIVTCIVLLIVTFNVWKMDSPSILFWFMPIIALFWIVLTIVDLIQIKKGKKWLEDKEEDEREMRYKYKAGYVAFWVNIVFLTIVFAVYGNFTFEIFEPIYAMITLVLVNIMVYFGMKIYFLFFK